MYYSKDQILEKLRKYCAYQDRCHWEVNRKLYELGADKEQSDEIILLLIQDKFLNEERFAVNAARGKWKMQSWGKVKIKQWLLARNIYPNLISKALDSIDQEDYLKSLSILCSKFHSKVGGKLSEKQKVIQKLQLKGYEFEYIESILSTYSWEDN